MTDNLWFVNSGKFPLQREVDVFETRFKKWKEGEFWQVHFTVLMSRRTRQILGQAHVTRRITRKTLRFVTASKSDA